LIRGNFEAWQYGLVHREAYESFKRLGAKAITEDADKFDPVTGMHHSFCRSNVSLAQSNIVAMSVRSGQH
jgi:uncharacterized phage-associated protein